jgi:adenosylcobinamide kinase / adenosylcobinamide-phosphate guanylyltransferase
MPLTFLVGGARSGKSALAVALARDVAGDDPVQVVATAEAGDDEMVERIARHRAERPQHWSTIEAPRSLDDAIAALDGAAVVVVDCLSFWVANRVMAGDGAVAIEAEAGRAARWAAARDGLVIAVSNEVGSGIVPDNALARSFRDCLGRVNAIWSVSASRAYLVVAGRALPLADAVSVVEAHRPQARSR